MKGRRTALGLFLLLIIFVSSEGSPINEQIAVPIGGIQQWISLKGADDRAPVLLYLHGGPGNSVMGYANKFTSELQKHFVVVQWDQRASGKTARLQAAGQTPTVDVMVNDAVEMLRYLGKRFSQEKIWLVGHSWGGFLALMVASKNPELLRACVALSPMIDQLKSERLALEEMIAKATKEGNANAQSDLATVRIPFENVTQLYLDRKWMAKQGGRPAPLKPFVLNWGKTWFPLFAEACQINLFETAGEIRCPVYLCIGKWDIQTHYRVAEEYFKALKAEKKELFWFSESGHNLNLTEPAKFQNIVISLIQSKN